VVFLILCAGWYTYDTILTQLPRIPTATFGLLPAARHVQHGESPFLEDSYIYPRSCLVNGAVRRAQLSAGALVWFVFSQGCLLWAAWLVYGYLGRGLVAACSVALVWAGGRAGEKPWGWAIGTELALLLAIAYTRLIGAGRQPRAGRCFEASARPCAIAWLWRCWRPCA